MVNGIKTSYFLIIKGLGGDEQTQACKGDRTHGPGPTRSAIIVLLPFLFPLFLGIVSDELRVDVLVLVRALTFDRR